MAGHRRLIAQECRSCRWQSSLPKSPLVLRQVTHKANPLSPLQQIPQAYIGHQARMAWVKRRPWCQCESKCLRLIPFQTAGCRSRQVRLWCFLWHARVTVAFQYPSMEYKWISYSWNTSNMSRTRICWNISGAGGETTYGNMGYTGIILGFIQKALAPCLQSRQVGALRPEAKHWDSCGRHPMGI